MSVPVPLSVLRLCALLLLTAIVSGCATTGVRGQLDYDVRPKSQRADVVWPSPPEKPRYRYVGELVGEQNFMRNDQGQASLTSAMKWLVGLFEKTEPLMLLRPQHGAVADNGRIYVVDAGRSALMVFDPHPPAGEKADKDGGQLLVWDAPAENIRFAGPAAVAIAWNGDIVVSDAKLGVVLRLNPKGELVGWMGEGHLKRPTGLAFDSKRGLLFVADTVANDIKVYDEGAQLLNTIGGAGERTGLLNAPTHLSFADGFLYVTDTYNSRIQVYDADGLHIRSFGERGLYVGNLARPKGVAAGEGGIVYVVESYYGHLLVFNQRDQLLLGINGSGIKGDRFFLPSGVWTDNKGRIYLADMFNGRVVVFQFLGNKDE